MSGTRFHATPNFFNLSVLESFSPATIIADLYSAPFSPATIIADVYSARFSPATLIADVYSERFSPATIIAAVYSALTRLYTNIAAADHEYLMPHKYNKTIMHSFPCIVWPDYPNI